MENTAVSVVFLHGGRVFGFGDNSCGQLGLGDLNSREMITEILVPTKVVSVCSGPFIARTTDCTRLYVFYFTIAVDEDGNLWGWGRYEMD
jgi:alpha-tubulin suppressor-like RCC1 family protein